MSVRDVDRLMEELVRAATVAACKELDFALSQIDGAEAHERIRHYLFHGELVQRNYAALWFKRRGLVKVLDQAVRRGLIDRVQAFSK
ncbi:MAG: hypothetical protein ACREMQ_17900 [Longimicrobiales bacterium]